MEFTFKVMRTKKTFELLLEENLQFYDIAVYFLEIEEILSMDIGIYSKKKQYYTENQSEELQNIGTGSDDTYLLLEGDLKDQYKNQEKIIVYKFNIVRTQITYELELDWQLQVKDIADFFYENQVTISMDIGIYSEKQKYYTENQDELLKNIGTGFSDTYLILEGNLKDEYNPKLKNIITKDIMIYLYIKNVISANINKVKITVNPLMKVCELIKLIQTNYHINDVQLLKKRNWVNIELHQPQYQMQTLDKVGIKKSQTLDVQENPEQNIYKRQFELNIHKSWMDAISRNKFQIWICKQKLFLIQQLKFKNVENCHRKIYRILQRVCHSRYLNRWQAVFRIKQSTDALIFIKYHKDYLNLSKNQIQWLLFRQIKKRIIQQYEYKQKEQGCNDVILQISKQKMNFK